jgi:predicted ester cyclase
MAMLKENLSRWFIPASNKSLVSLRHHRGNGFKVFNHQIMLYVANPITIVNQYFSQKNQHIMKPLFIIITVLSCIALGCNSNPSTETKTDTSATSTNASKADMTGKNKETALAVLQSVNSHNVDAVLKDASPDMVDYGEGSTPPAKGIDSCKALLQMFLTAFPDIKGENLMAIAEGNHVAVFGDWSGTFKGEMMGMKPTGKSYKVKDVDLFTFNDAGKMTEHRSVQSNETIMMQVGANK